jgi:hypothetical protein
MDPKAFEVTLDYRSENSTELLPVEESMLPVPQSTNRRN